jgi:hypothetical protein
MSARKIFWVIPRTERPNSASANAASNASKIAPDVASIVISTPRF